MTLCADGLQCRTKVSRMLDYATGKGMDVHQLGKEWMYTDWERNGCTPTGKGMDVHQLGKEWMYTNWTCVLHLFHNTHYPALSHDLDISFT